MQAGRTQAPQTRLSPAAAAMTILLAVLRCALLCIALLCRCLAPAAITMLIALRADLPGARARSIAMADPRPLLAHRRKRHRRQQRTNHHNLWNEFHMRLLSKSHFDSVRLTAFERGRCLFPAASEIENAIWSHLNSRITRATAHGAAAQL
jgi:hypothetical protein